MKNTTIKPYNILRSKNFNEEEAAAVVEEVEKTVDRKFDINGGRFATKKDIMDLKDLIHNSINNLFLKMTCVILGQMGLIFLILKLVGVFD